MFARQQLNLNPFNLANCDLVFGPVLKFDGPGRLMRSDLLGMLEPASILQVNRHTGRAPGMIPHRRQKLIKHPDCCKLLFDGRLRAGHLLEIGSHMERPDRVQRESVFARPMKELVTGPRISQPGIPVPDGP
jgi:hypothetical protein